MYMFEMEVNLQGGPEVQVSPEVLAYLDHPGKATN